MYDVCYPDSNASSLYEASIGEWWIVGCSGGKMPVLVGSIESESMSHDEEMRRKHGFVHPVWCMCLCWCGVELRKDAELEKKPRKG